MTRYLAHTRLASILNHEALMNLAFVYIFRSIIYSNNIDSRKASFFVSYSLTKKLFILRIYFEPTRLERKVKHYFDTSKLSLMSKYFAKASKKWTFNFMACLTTWCVCYELTYTFRGVKRKFLCLAWATILADVRLVVSPSAKSKHIISLFCIHIFPFQNVRNALQREQVVDLTNKPCDIHL